MSYSGVLFRRLLTSSAFSMSASRFDSLIFPLWLTSAVELDTNCQPITAQIHLLRAKLLPEVRNKLSSAILNIDQIVPSLDYCPRELIMCFGNSTIDDPTQPPRKASVWTQKSNTDPTKQPIHITESNEAYMSEHQDPNAPKHVPHTYRRKSSYKNRGEFVDVTAQDYKPVARRPSNPEPAPTQPKSKKTAAQQNWRGRSSNPATFGFGMGSDFSASPGGF